ncbi:MAG: type IX secretion system sortase PorU [Bacteroidales bacterium]|nr:type IX secretion system sortase PorU [Bacteroidales bacterium]
MDISHLTERPLLEYSLVREAGFPRVIIKVLPFVRMADGSVHRVDSFEIDLEQEAALAPLKSARAGSWAEHSLLASGRWFRVSVGESGIHKLSYEQLLEIGLDNPASVRVFGSGASLLPEQYSLGCTDDLEAVPLHIHKGTDGIFGPGDHILFYATGPVHWQYDEMSGMYLHHLHSYSRKGHYFLTDSQGASAPPEDAELSTGASTHTVSSYDYRDYHEEETYNLIQSGREWYGDVFSVNLSGLYPFHLEGRMEGEPVRIRTVAAARSGVSSTFSISAHNELLGTISVSGTNLSHYTSTYAYESAGTFSYLPEWDELDVKVSYNRPDSNSEGWLNSICINGRSELSFSGSQLAFRDSRSAGPGNISQFLLDEATEDILIWEITDPQHPKNIGYALEGSVARFTMETNDHREFIAFRPEGNYPVPDFTGDGLGLLGNQDLHGLSHPEMVILTPELFLEEANRLAMFRRDNDGMEVAVVTQQQVFNEFSSGTPDVTAIRNFMKMFYDRSGATGNSCRYLLLLGDGSYDNRGSDEKQYNTNLILTYQSEESLSPTGSYVSDDYFGLLDTDERMYDGLLDIGIGRLPASDREEAAALVDKIIAYGDPDRQGSWRNQLCFIGDDEDSNIHMRQADELATYVNDRYSAYNIQKIYLDAYPQEELSTGPSYPEVTRAVNDQVHRGALIINYTGHGGTQGLAHEKILTSNDIRDWKNKKMLPLFMTATCEFSRYDQYNRAEDLEITSGGEQILHNTEGGGIGLFTTTRLVYSGPNHALNERFYEVVFEKNADQQNYRLGDIIVYSKNNTGAGINKRNFTLLGDPSLRLSYPGNRVLTDSINGSPVSMEIDTLSALQWVSIAGHLESQDSLLLSGFEGKIYPRIFDKERSIETLSNDGGPVFTFSARNNILYSGEATVSQGRFNFGFYMPKDINYAYGPGKISYYSTNQEIDAHGSFEDFSVGGISSGHVTDSEPPVVDLFLNDSFFISGGITDPDPLLLAYVSDSYGINTTGNGIGHDLTATLDDDRISSVILNEFYQANTNSYNSGIVSYPYSNLEPGKHTVTLKIWDIHNNSTEKSIDFMVVDSEEMLMEQIYNYPNPFFDRTWFSIAHNRPDSQLRLVLSIYSLSGEMVRLIDMQVNSPGYRLEPLMWDGTSSGGTEMGGGVYIYRATLSTEEGEVASSSGKLIIAR